MTFLTAFPDYPPADMPEMPAGFFDASWRNDACPCFMDNARGLALWLDYADPALSEFPEARASGAQRRFTLAYMERQSSEPGDWGFGDIGANPPPVAESDDMAEILAALATFNREGWDRVAMAHKMAADIRATLDPHRLALVCAGEADPCDFIDDNTVTSNAYVTVYAEGFDCTDAQLARANVATVLAARLLRGQELSAADMLATVARDDITRGLAPTITRAGAFDDNVAMATAVGG